VKVEVRDIVADCPACRGSDFVPEQPKLRPLAPQAIMVCTGCGAKMRYIELLVQIGDKAIAHSQETLEKLRQEREAMRAKRDKTPPE
jgi:hypothetical protein